MRLHQNGADVFVPDASGAELALARCTHLAIGAHQDDLEFFAFHGIAACYENEEQWFAGVTCTNGGGSARTGPFEGFTDAEMQGIRADEQRQAAAIGKYAAMIQLDYPSSAIKDPGDPRPVDDLEAILKATRPEVLYLHNPADKHDTHIAVLLRSLAALHRLPRDQRPAKVWGCEVWRGLDWMLDEDKVVLPTSELQDLQEKLNGVFQSQIAGGKRYDLAVMGRRRANATFSEAHVVDAETGAIHAMDLTPLVHDESLDLGDYVSEFIDRLKRDVAERIGRFGSPSADS